MLEIKSTGSKLLLELLTLVIATFPLDLMTTCAPVSVEGGGSCESVTTLAADIGTSVPVVLVLLALIDGVEHKAVATYIGASESLVLRVVWAVERRVAFRWIICILHRLHGGWSTGETEVF